ncbi:MAG: GTPase ObgE [Candidatus Aminicenantes bacterium]|nr:GTPase ObgE [Candidatus Aminicenantes bacterium]
MFADQAKVILFAGKGGNGCVSFRRESHVPKGGPDGGKGGDGGSIYFVSDERVRSLSYFRSHSVIKAERGRHGQGSNCNGKKGEDLFLKIPVGTIIRNKGQMLFDFVKPGQKFLVAKGGKGGRGNSSFVSSTNQAPQKYEEGTEGEETEIILELKLIADVGLVGFPNVGKSTLISKISAAKPVIADYPFTTIAPNLGVVDTDEFHSFVVADIPGLIEGAHQGHGLGIQFLKHIERTRLIIHLVDVSPYSQRHPVNDYFTVRNELKEFKESLLGRPQILVANKIDLLGENKQRLEVLKDFATREQIPFIAISAIKSKGLKKLISEVDSRLKDLKKHHKQSYA